jgi:MYXO-CTERM domain-containing protein
VALSVILFLRLSVGALGRAALLAYALLMAPTLVYTGEHFVADVVAGWLIAAVAVVAAAATRRRRNRGVAT